MFPTKSSGKQHPASRNFLLACVVDLQMEFSNFEFLTLRSNACCCPADNGCSVVSEKGLNDVKSVVGRSVGWMASGEFIEMSYGRAPL